MVYILICVCVCVYWEPDVTSWWNEVASSVWQRPVHVRGSQRGITFWGWINEDLPLAAGAFGVLATECGSQAGPTQPHSLMGSVITGIKQEGERVH